MAKYTILLSDYLKEGGSLPQIFNEIEGFTDLFIGEYFAREIGFETTNLFELKLQHRANLVIPFYKEKIQAIIKKYTDVELPTKTYYTSNDLTFNKGATSSKRTDLPNTGSYTSVEPSSVLNNEEYTDNTYQTTENKETGNTSDELVRMLRFLNNDLTNNVYKTLLLEFSNLFMVIY